MRHLTNKPFNKRNQAKALALILVPLALLTACGSETGSAEPTSTGQTADSGLSGTVTVYTSEPQAKIDEIITAYNEIQPDVEVEVFRAGTGELTTRVATEKKSGGIQADILLAADVPTFENYAAEGDLQVLDIENAVDVNENVVDAEGYYVGTRIIPTVIAYNTNLIQDAPTSWAALTDSEYKNQIAMPNPEVSGAAAFNTAVWLEEEELGEDWLKALVDNEPTVLESNGPVGQAVASGTAEIGIVVDYVARELAEAGSPLKLNYPTDGVPYVSQPAGIFADSQNPEAANSFIDFLISQEGQKIAVNQSYVPVRDDAGVPEGAPQLADIELINPDLELIASTKDAAIEKFNDLLD